MEWIINNGKVSPTVLEAGKYKIKEFIYPMSGEG
jgi:membrane protease subunit (stomatin/prohibitin family)